MGRIINFAKTHLPRRLVEILRRISWVRRKIASMPRRLLHWLRYYLPHKFTHSCWYYKTHGERMDWDNPKTYDEKIHWLIVNVYDKSYGRYADKLMVRNYIKECGLEDLLVPLYGVYKNAKEIDFEKLPDRFILMCTHGSGGGYYELCTDKRSLDIKAVRKKLNRALRKRWEKTAYEYHYVGCEPRILCMEYLEDAPGSSLTDYKIHCTYGEPLCILVCKDRGTDLKRDIYSTDWEYLDYAMPDTRIGEIIAKPKHLEQMLEIAKILSAPFPLSRIDLYEVGGKIYFGEITLTPEAGNLSVLNKKGQIELGERTRLTKTNH